MLKCRKRVSNKKHKSTIIINGLNIKKFDHDNLGIFFQKETTI